jgi:hypothetical protein
MPLSLSSFRLDHPDLRKIWTAPGGFDTHMAGQLLGTRPHSSESSRYCPQPVSKPQFFTPGALPPRSFLLAALASGRRRLLLQGLCVMGYMSPALSVSCGLCFASTFLVVTLVQQ